MFAEQLFLALNLLLLVPAFLILAGALALVFYWFVQFSQRKGF